MAPETRQKQQHKTQPLTSHLQCYSIDDVSNAVSSKATRESAWGWRVAIDHFECGIVKLATTPGY